MSFALFPSISIDHLRTRLHYRSRVGLKLIIATDYLVPPPNPPQTVSGRVISRSFKCSSAPEEQVDYCVSVHCEMDGVTQHAHQ